MRTTAPITSVDGAMLTVRTELTFDDGTALPALEVGLPRTSAGILDPTATPALLLLAAVAAAHGEDVEVAGPADATAVDAAIALAGRLAARWSGRPGPSAPSRPAGAPTPTVRAATTHVTPAADGRDGVGLLFDGGVDAWAALLDSEQDGDDAVTHLVVVDATSPSTAADTVVRSGSRTVAADRGLVLVEVTTTAPAVLAAAGAPAEAEVLGRVAAALVAGAGLRRLLVPDPVDATLLTGPATDGPPSMMGAVDVVGATDLTWVERVALVAADPRARAAVRACADASTAGDCGRCVPCLLLQSTFTLVGDPEPRAGFVAPLHLHAVRFAPLDDAHAEAVAALVDGLPPAHEALRRAWADAWDESQGRPTPSRWGLGGPPPLPGPDQAFRVAAALRSTTGHPDAPMPARLGWQPGAVPLRPALADHEAVRAAATTGPDRPRAWAVIEPHVRDGRRDGEQSRLALRAQQALGPGLAYLPGILWADEQVPVLGPAAISRLLRTARARLWWREDGDLDPLRTVEAVEHGCLPLQVMPDGAAAALAATLPSALAPLVVADSAVPYLDLSPDAVAARFDPVLDHLLGGSAERDLLRGTARG